MLARLRSALNHTAACDSFIVLHARLRSANTRRITAVTTSSTVASTCSILFAGSEHGDRNIVRPPQQ